MSLRACFFFRHFGFGSSMILMQGEWSTNIREFYAREANHTEPPTHAVKFEAQEWFRVPISLFNRFLTYRPGKREIQRPNNPLVAVMLCVCMFHALHSEYCYIHTTTFLHETTVYISILNSLCFSLRKYESSLSCWIVYVCRLYRLLHVCTTTEFCNVGGGT